MIPTHVLTFCFIAVQNSSAPAALDETGAFSLNCRHGTCVSICDIIQSGEKSVASKLHDLLLTSIDEIHFTGTNIHFLFLLEPSQDFVLVMVKWSVGMILLVDVKDP